MKMRACCLMLISWYNTQRSIQITFFPTLAKQVTWNVLSFGIGFVVYGSTGPTFISASGSVHAWHWMQEHGYNASCASVSPMASQNLLGMSSFLWEMEAIQ
jgi:hypothetical protein